MQASFGDKGTKPLIKTSGVLVIVGGGKDAEKLIRAIHESADNDIDLVGLFDDRVDERSPDIVANCPKLGNVRQLIEFARLTRLDLVIVSMRSEEHTSELQSH